MSATLWHLAYAAVILIVIAWIARTVARLIIDRRPLPGRTGNFIRTVVAVVVMVALLIAVPGVWGVFKIPTPSRTAAAELTTPLASDNPALVDCKVGDKAVGKKTASDCDNLNTLASLIPPAATAIPLIDCKVGDKAVGKKTQNDCDNLNAFAGLIPSAAPAVSTPTRGTPVANNATPVPANSGQQQLPCRLEQGGPWNELSDTGGPKQRIEVGGGDIAAYDLYQVPPAVTLIVPEQPMKLYYGFGTSYRGNKGECANFDWIGAFTEYAKARAGNGHSGVVIDLRGGTPKVVANLQNLTDAQLATLMVQFKDLFDTSVVTHGATPAPLPASTGGNSGCKDVGTDHPVEDANKTWDIPADNTWRVVLWWSRATDPNVKNMKTILEPGKGLKILGGGGTLVTFSGTGCDSAAQARMKAETTFNEPTPAQVATYFK